MANIPVRQIKSSEKEPELSQSFRIRDVRNLLAGKDMVHDLHRHDFFYVLALEKGKGNHEIDFIPYKVEDRCIFILRPGQVHQLTLKAGSTGYLMVFNMSFYRLNNKGANQVLRKATSTNVCKLDKSGFAKLHSVLTYIFQEYKDQEDGYQEVIKANLDIFLIELVRHRRHGKIPTLNGSAYAQERLEEFLELLEATVASQKQVAEYAEMLNLSVYQLNAITKTALGKTPSEIINEYIILESKRHLLATSDQVNQIAYHLGYEDPSYFIRFFRKHTGYSPEVFRSKFQLSPV